MVGGYKSLIFKQIILISHWSSPGIGIDSLHYWSLYFDNMQLVNYVVLPKVNSTPYTDSPESPTNCLLFLYPDSINEALNCIRFSSVFIDSLWLYNCYNFIKIKIHIFFAWTTFVLFILYLCNLYFETERKSLHFLLKFYCDLIHNNFCF